MSMIIIIPKPFQNSDGTTHTALNKFQIASIVKYSIFGYWAKSYGFLDIKHKDQGDFPTLKDLYLIEKYLENVYTN